MKPARVLLFFYVAVMAFWLSACSGGKPESAVQAFYAAAAKGDTDKAITLISFASVPATQMMQAKGKVQMIVGEMKNRIDANDGLADVTVLDTRINDDDKTANVQVKIKYRNGKEQTEAFQLVKEDGRWKLLLK